MGSDPFSWIERNCHVPPTMSDGTSGCELHAAAVTAAAIAIAMKKRRSMVVARLRSYRHPTVYEQNQYRAERRHDVPGAFTGLIEAQQPADKAAQYRADNPESGRQDDASWIVARHQELGHKTDDQAE